MLSAFKKFFHPLAITLFAAILFSTGIILLTFSINRKKTICPKCNIIIIDIDTLRADALSCQGPSKPTSPNICEFFKKGVIFEQNFAQSNWTLPSIFSTMTSKYPFAHGMYESFRDRLSWETPTMAEYFKKAGYQTIWAGEVGESWGPTVKNGGLRGFDEVIEPEPFRQQLSSWSQIVRQVSLKQSPFFIYFYSSDLHMPYTLNDNEVPIDDLGKPDGFPVSYEDFLPSLADYLKEHVDSVFTPLAIDAHPELFRDIEATDKYKILEYFQSLDLDKTGSDISYVFNGFSPFYWSYTNHIYSDDAEDQRKRVQYVRMLYDSKVFSVDSQLSQLFKVLDESEISQNTIVVLLSDHGEEFMEHGEFGHTGHLYNELLHVPLLIAIPGVIPGRKSEVTQNIDVLPTLIDATRIYRISIMQGNSLIPLMKGQSRVNDAYSISSIEKSASSQMSIQNNRWKLIADSSGGLKSIELYDLEVDPLEQHNILDREPKLAEGLLRVLKKSVEQKRDN